MTHYTRNSCLENRLDFFVSDGNCLATSGERYDMVISTGVLHSLKNPVAFLNECYRVLKPGREAWVFDPAKLALSKESFLQRDWKKGTKFLLYLGMALLIQIFKPRPYSQKEVIEIVEKTHFSYYTISGENCVKIKLKKGLD
jgi:ubiquinone/menaquinone biosynthesis C-methylase UbiE